MAVLILTISFAANAYRFGTVNQGSTQVSEHNLSFEIDILNLNNQTLEIRPAVKGLEKGNATFPADTTIEPSKVSGNPEGDGWIAIEPGRYAKPTSFNFNVVTFENKVGSDEFKIRLEAKTQSESPGSDLNQKVVQVREYSYNIELPEKEDRPTVDRGFEDSQDEEEFPQIIEKNDSALNNSSTSRNMGNITINDTDISQATKTSDNSTSTGRSQGIDKTTVILSAGVLGSIAYLWMIL